MENQYFLKNKKIIKIINDKIFSSRDNKFIFDIYLKNYIIIIIYSFIIYIIYKINSDKNYVFSPKNRINYIIRGINDNVIISLNGKLINKKTMNLFYPKISASVIIYNSEKTIKSAIRSIQNQNMSEIEIILIDDHSSDKSVKIIEQLQKEDQRIKIIKNNKNSGSLYSRSIAILFSKAKYIMALDSDDLFINKNIFNICYNEAENNYLDIVEFSGFSVKKHILRLNNKLPNIAFYLRNKENNLIVKKPYLFNFLYLKHKGKIVKLIDGYIWGKCIRKNIYIKVLNKLGKNVYEQYMNFGEDRIINFVLFQIANSFKFIEEYGIIYIYNPLSIFNSYKKELITHDELINLMNIYNLTKNSPDLNIVVFELKYRWKNIIIPGLNPENKNKTIYLIKLLLKSKYINSIDKNKLKTLFKEIN